jgi:hypothetical protein
MIIMLTELSVLPRFRLGNVLATPNVISEVTRDEILQALNRHSRGDWGEVGGEDRKANEDALQSEERLLSVYTSSSGTKFWVITAADRSSTTVLLPEDY